jgi:glycosyltransferase involved in cell wall biosynthesis
MAPAKRPRIYLDGYNLDLEQGTGVATYARNLSFMLGDLDAEVGVLYGTQHSTLSTNPLIREIAFFDSKVDRPSKWVRLLHGIRRNLSTPFGEIATQVPISGRVVSTAYQNRMPHYDTIYNVQNLFASSQGHYKVYRTRMDVHFRSPPDVMHWTYPLALKVTGARNMYTLHDLVPLRLPYTTLDNKRSYFDLCRMLVRRANHIVTVSESSKRDIVNLLGASEEKVTNTYQIVDIPAKYANRPVRDVVGDVEGTLGVGYKRYYLFFGAIEPKKNVGRLIEAYLASGAEDPLLIVGKKAWKSQQELRLLTQNDHIRYLVTNGGITRTRARVQLVGYVPYPLLISLIRGAKAVLFPSLYEGFGLPALEAMMLGTPVLTSNTASLPEVVGNAAVLCDPYDVRSMVDGIRALDSDEDLRGRLSTAGPQQAAQFNGERYRAKLREAYAKVGVKWAA